MTQIDFHTGVGDTLDYTCRLLKKAWPQALAQDTTVLVLGESAWLGALNERLWTFSAETFIPHDVLHEPQDEPARLLPRVWLGSPDVLLTAAAQSLHHLLIHVGATSIEQLRGFERFDRFIEIVGSHPTDGGAQASSDVVQAGRLRFQHYKNHGYPLKHYPCKNQAERLGVISQS